MQDISKDMNRLIRDCKCSPLFAFYMCTRIKSINNKEDYYHGDVWNLPYAIPADSISKS